MRTLIRCIAVLGVIDVLAAVALYIGGGYLLGFAWLGAFDLYVELDKRDVIDHVKLAAVEPKFVEGYALGDRLIGVPVGAGYDVTTVGAAALALNGVVLLVAAAWARRKSLRQETPAPVAGASDPGSRASP
jgi:hypothetical protein